MVTEGKRNLKESKDAPDLEEPMSPEEQKKTDFGYGGKIHGREVVETPNPSNPLLPTEPLP
jgi:hypothetical protein